MATFGSRVYLSWALFAIPAARPGDSFLEFPSTSNCPAEAAANTQIKKCFL